MTDKESTALATTGAELSLSLTFRLGLEPESLEAVRKLAVDVVKSRVFKVESPEDAMMRILTARSLGLPAVVGLRKMHCVEGQLGMAADLIRALVQQHPSVEYFDFVESTAELATMELKRYGRPAVRYTYSIEDAKRAGLVDRPDWGKLTPEALAEKRAKSNWWRNPKAMLRARCTTDMASMYVPAASMGMSSIEELRDERDRSAIETTAHDPTTGEILEPIGAKPDRSAKLDELRQAIEAAKSPEEFKAVRKSIEASDVPAFELEPLKELYSKARDAAKAQAKP